jgi:hypothetical protein
LTVRAKPDDDIPTQTINVLQSPERGRIA